MGSVNLIGLTKMTFEQQREENEWASYVLTWGKNLPGLGKSLSVLHPYPLNPFTTFKHWFTAHFYIQRSAPVHMSEGSPWAAEVFSEVLGNWCLSRSNPVSNDWWVWSVHEHTYLDFPVPSQENPGCDLLCLQSSHAGLSQSYFL